MSTIKVNTLDSTTGTTITVPTGKTFVVTDTGALTIGGTAITTGSSNILRKTTDYTIVSGDVTAKSEVVIATNAAAATRTITLPAVATSGLSTCIITIVADADATSTYKLTVVDSSAAEVWTGYQKGDFVRLIVSNSVWVVIDHKETYFSRRYLTANQNIAVSAIAKLTGWTSVSEIGNMWDNSNDKIVFPSNMSGWMDVSLNMSNDTNYTGISPALYLDGSVHAQPEFASGVTDGSHFLNNLSGRWAVTTAQELEFYGRNVDSNTAFTVYGAAASRTTFDVTFTRTY